MKNSMILFVVLFAANLFSQSAGNASINLQLNQIAQVDIEPNNTAIILTINAPNEAGEKAQVGTSNNTKWINFSSSIPPASGLRNLSASIISGNVPAGVRLKLRVAPYVGIGAGQLGIPVSEIQLNNTLQTIVANIGGAYTGNGINNGYNITYLLEIIDYQLLNFSNSQTLSISLTLSEI